MLTTTIGSELSYMHNNEDESSQSLFDSLTPRFLSEYLNSRPQPTATMSTNVSSYGAVSGIRHRYCSQRLTMSWDEIKRLEKICQRRLAVNGSEATTSLRRRCFAHVRILLPGYSFSILFAGWALRGRTVEVTRAPSLPETLAILLRR